MQATPQKRIPYIDWMRGLACLVMFQTHCYDSWLGGTARQGSFFSWSQLGGSLPAPLFLFLTGLSLALVTDRLREKGVAAGQIARKTILRGAEIFVLALAFRLQEFVLGLPGASWKDVLRVDILNVIGIAIMLMGAMCWMVATINALDSRRLRWENIVAGGAVCAAISAFTPPLWTSWLPHWRAWWLESYINGVDTLGKPQPWLFPVFPWAAFAFAGLAAGFLLRGDRMRRNEAALPVASGAAGVALILLGYALDASKIRLYAHYDFWHTSPNFLLMRLGVLLLILSAAYYWCKWTGAGQRFSPLIEMGRCSLLIYWVHIEFVYGRVSILPKRATGIATATAGLAVIFIFSVLLAVARNRFPGWRNLFSTPMRGNAGLESPAE